MSEQPEKKNDIPEKGAIVQRDRRTFAVAPHIPGGVCDPSTLRILADVAEKYGARACKITSAQRIALIGLKEEDLDAVWNELGMTPGAAMGLCVRSVKMCPGTTYCRLGQQDSLELGRRLDGKYHGVELPSKMKLGVSGCPNSCAETWLKDIGFIGSPKGWKVVVGGNAGARPMIAVELTTVATTDEAVELTDRIVDFYKNQPRRLRLGKLVQEMGLDAFRETVGLPVEPKKD